jgi:hypothetical protein
MKTKLFATIAVAAMLVGGGLAIAQMPGQSQPKPDPRVEKLLSQNEQILKNQDDIKSQLSDIKDALADLKESILILKRRSS